ncbi:small glutamine-rich tetratricopeptide repeat-containing protein 2-like [Stegodyphus dumicola]|uniref:small glutamine-rich tetratricopeptide repeat-containing protein 2-like n=1 Tax=Stegodyphus dumicola TaxID=202533 RepID=UPI0015B31BCA|nr:small glutamine-rich tetratricopeptide repeat-containing protein 2-like [Stegodyphus dumicola]
MSDEDDSRRLVVAITDFLREQLQSREDMTPEDRDSLEIAIECLEMAYGLENNDYTLLRFSRPLQDMFAQVANPVPVKAKLEADECKIEGNRKVVQGQFQEAVDLYTRAIELDKWNAIYYCNRAGARIELRNFFDAVEDCRFALTLNPDYAKAYARMGQAYAMMNKHRRAAWCYRKALDLEPENEQYRNNLSVSENQSGVQGSISILQNILSSIFGGGSSNQGNDFGGIFMPSAVAIITRTPQRADSETDDQSSVDESMNIHQDIAQTPVNNGKETGYDSETSRPDSIFSNQNTNNSTLLQNSSLNAEECRKEKPYNDQTAESEVPNFSISSIPAEYCYANESAVTENTTTESNILSNEMQQNNNLSQSNSNSQKCKYQTLNTESKDSTQIMDSISNNILRKDNDKIEPSTENDVNSSSAASDKSKNEKLVSKECDSVNQNKKDDSSKT